MRIGHSWIQILKQYHQNSAFHHLQPLLFSLLTSFSDGFSPCSWQDAQKSLQLTLATTLASLRKRVQLSLLSSEKNSAWPRLGHMTTWADYIVVMVILEHGEHMVDPTRSLGSKGVSFQEERIQVKEKISQ